MFLTSFIFLGRYMPDIVDYSTGGAMPLPEDIFTSLPMYSIATFMGKIPSCIPVMSNYNHMSTFWGIFSSSEYQGYQQLIPSCTAEVLHMYNIHTFTSIDTYMYTRIHI
jgi:hypothetical protein